MPDFIPESVRANASWSGPGIALMTLAFIVASLWTGNHAPVWVSAAAGLLVAWAAWIDAESCRLPDALTLPLFALAMGYAAISGQDAFIAAAFGGVLGYGVMRLGGLYMDWRLKARFSMYGDAKFLAGLGALVAANGETALAVLPVILIACASGLAEGGLRAGWAGWRFSGGHVVFGPHLAAGFTCVWLLGADRLVALWLGLGR